MPFSEEDTALVKNPHLFKGYGSLRLLSELPGKTGQREVSTFCWGSSVKREALADGPAVED